MVLEEDFVAACLYIATAVVRVHWQYTRCKSPQNGLLWISSIPAALCLSPFNQWSRSGTSNGISAISQLEVPYVCPQQFLVCFISSFIFCITKTSWWGPSRYMVVTFLTRNHCKIASGFEHVESSSHFTVIYKSHYNCTEIAAGLHAEFWICNFKVTEIALSWATNITCIALKTGLKNLVQSCTFNMSKKYMSQKTTLQL